MSWSAAMLACIAIASPSWAGFDEGLSAYVRGDFATAFQEFTAAAIQGDPAAQFNLGGMYADGKGAKRDDQQAVIWYRKAAEAGNAHAQFELGGAYFAGRGVPKDDQQAVFWYRRAADQGQPNAQGMLGAMYRDGAGVPKEAQESASWFRKAANQGYVDAQTELGGLYADGKGVPKDYQQAVYWYRRAADQGDARGQLLLASMFNAGFGVAQDIQQAYFWALLASVQGFGPTAFGTDSVNLAVALRDSLEKKLTPAQREQAQAEAREWKPKAVGQAEAFTAGGVPEAKAAPTAVRREVLTSTGTGFFVAGGRVVTNHHVTNGCTRLRVGGKSEGRLLAIDARNDLALISVQGRTPDTATIRPGKLRIGESALVAGFPLSGLLSGFNVTTGNISSLAGVRGDTRLVQITAPVQPGNSGGPLLDGAGKVIGVVVSKLDALKVAESTGDVPQNVNFAINANVLASFLDANSVDYKSATVGAVIPTQEVARRAQAITVLIECWK